MTTDLREILSERIDAVAPSVGDLDAVRADGRRIRLRRRAALGAIAASAVVAVGGTVVALGGDDGPGPENGQDDAGFSGTLDFSAGVRAYADPGGEWVSLGGQRLPAEDLQWLDTDAAATSWGIVYYDRGRPTLFDTSGASTPLVSGPLDAARDFHPTAKAEAGAPVVAWATRTDGQVTITVHDLAAGSDVASTTADCGSCGGLVIDGIDGGVVFVRTAAGTRTWDSATGEWADFAPPATRVADVRNGVVLYDGPRPTAPADWTLVPGAIDAQLTFDGEHVLYWSSTLEATGPDGDPVLLDQGSVDGQGGDQWNVDSDGSILVMVADRKGTETTLYDCAIPTGTCEQLDLVSSRYGDPVFIGNDM